ncbi:MAG: NUDIX domain-containing protein [Candidatus Aenigmarchaeota archaeon]|nr:NUDIX domain-containing protein [Candidatus Aenigmarchaeota archaeon]
MRKERPLVGVGCQIIQGNKILLGRRKGSHGEGEWSGFGGHVEFGETLEECAKREVKEEVGLEVGNLRLLCISDIMKYGKKHYVDVEFTAKIKSGKPRIVDKENISELKWFDLKNLPKPLFEPVKIALEALKTKKVYFPSMGR